MENQTLIDEPQEITFEDQMKMINSLFDEQYDQSNDLEFIDFDQFSISIEEEDEEDEDEENENENECENETDLFIQPNFNKVLINQEEQRNEGKEEKNYKMEEEEEERYEIRKQVRKRPQLPQEAKLAMKLWLLNNILYPYPRDEIIYFYSRKYGLTFSQVKTFFSNNRLRFLKHKGRPCKKIPLLLGFINSEILKIKMI